MKKGIYYICSLFLELIALIIFKLTFRIDLTKKNPKKGESTHTPILLVHGYGHNSSAWIYLCYRLKKAGFHSLYSINLGSVQNSIEQYAEEVKRKALEIAESTGNKKLILLGHSMGGLVSAAYATHHSNVTHLVTLGSPLKGTKIAKWGRGQSARDMEPFSPFIVDLNRKIEAASDIKFFHIGTQTDLIIRPPHSAILEGRHQPKVLSLSHLGHLGLVYSSRVANELILFLSPSIL